MASTNCYDVTTWPTGDPLEDIGEVINSIIADIKSRQTATDVRDGGRPGAVIYIPPGDYRLRTQVLIDISYLRIEGSGHGFTSSSIRFNVPQDEWRHLQELWPGGSRVLVDLAPQDDAGDTSGAAFLVERPGSPRVSSVEFANFCIDGLRFCEDGSGMPAANTYRNGKTGIRVASANDSLRITGMGLVYLEHGLVIHHADALSVHDNFVAECGSCIELRGWGQASKVTDNLIGAGFHGPAVLAENHGGLLIASNNIFPRGASSIELAGVTRSLVSGNRMHSFYPGMVVLRAGSSENLITSNHLLRDDEPWAPFVGVDNGLDDPYGILVIEGGQNSVIGNHFSEVVDARKIRPSGATPVIVHVVSGSGNYVANNHVVAKDVRVATGDSCFAAQVDALLATEASGELAVVTVLIDAQSRDNVVLDSGADHQVVMDRAVNAFRPTPAIGAGPAAPRGADLFGTGR
ncbi:NosD domain-containing protein [Actinotalea sp. K2]|uniref:NosD domain-containing protein n=1 Tax=Actinotalea sp. K2 TaxID=2939438 RepID=UPI002016FA0E|nr:NosD domain-containing protein [Actinotalea sp. K2]MCL3861075.1 right-handed parallel beta-helix repeat-containing protein [Actinotalea sp. K2]